MSALTGVAATEDFYEAQQALALYDFRNPTKLGREKVRRLELMHETFERAMSARLGGLLRTMVRVEALAVDQITYDEYVRSMPNPTVIGLFGFEDREGQFLVEMSTSTALTLVDRVLGGLGTPGIVRRPTEVETALIEDILGVAESCIDETFEPVLPVRSVLNGIEYNPNFAQAANAPDMTAVMSFALSTLEGHRFDGLMTICYPFAVLEPAWEAVGDLDARPLALEAGTGGPRVGNRIPGVEIEMAARLKPSRISTGEFAHLQPGDVLRLDHRLDDKVVGVVRGRPILEGRLGQKNNNVAIEVTNWSEE